MVVTVENNNGEQNVGGQRVGENQGSALDQFFQSQSGGTSDQS